MRLWLPLTMLALSPVAAGAEGVLTGQPVALRALVIDAAGAPPRLASRAIDMIAGPEVELPSMQQLRASWGDDASQIVDISVDLETDSILISYGAAGYAQYTDGFFAGYEFALPGLPQSLIERAELDRVQRLPGMGSADLFAVPGALRLNLSGKWVSPDGRIRIRFPETVVPSV